MKFESINFIIISLISQLINIISQSPTVACIVW